MLRVNILRPEVHLQFTCIQDHTSGSSLIGAGRWCCPTVLLSLLVVDMQFNLLLCVCSILLWSQNTPSSKGQEQWANKKK